MRILLQEAAAGLMDGITGMIFFDLQMDPAGDQCLKVV
jgi:hypothetical protein